MPKRLSDISADELQAAIRAVKATGFQARVRLTPEGAIIEPFVHGTDATEPTSPKEFVYLIGFDSWVKIGYTGTSVKKRLEGLQTSIPIKLQLIHSMPGSLELEARLHLRFSQYRRQGEWFAREGDLAAWIDAGCPLPRGDDAP